MPEQPDPPTSPFTEPASPFTELATAAVQLHELFITYQDAGFTEAQALYLVAQMSRPPRGSS